MPPFRAMDSISQDQRQYRSSDSSDGLPPLQRKRKKKGKGSLQTNSAPLSPNVGRDLLETGTPRQLQQPSRLSMSTGRAPIARRATMSDAGQIQDHGLVDVKLQLAPVLDCCATKEPSSKAVSFIEEIPQSSGKPLKVAGSYLNHRHPMRPYTQILQAAELCRSTQQCKYL